MDRLTSAVEVLAPENRATGVLGLQRQGASVSRAGAGVARLVVQGDFIIESQVGVGHEVDGVEVELAGNKEDDRLDGRQLFEDAGTTPSGLEQTADGFKPLVGRMCALAKMPSR